MTEVEVAWRDASLDSKDDAARDNAALYPYPAGLALVSKVGARRNSAGAILRYDSPAQLRTGIEDNLRTSQSISCPQSICS
jgi:hypothetical protein